MLTAEVLKKFFSYDPDTGAITRLTTHKPVYIELKGITPKLYLWGRQYNARRVVITMQTGSWPIPHAFKFTGEDPRDLRWVNFRQRLDGTKRRCADCGEFHEEELFPYIKEGRRASYCPTCLPKRRNTYEHSTAIKNKYGVTGKQYDEQLKLQGGVCDICKGGCDRRLAVDHCHSTGKARALLCMKCNTGLGAFKDSPKVLLEAAKYLLRHKP